jgi:pSer/pThr/pTyr-binding forkhead associated (FHA) protein
MNEDIPTRIYLIHKNQIIKISSACTLIGRHPNNDLVLNYPAVSKFHAELVYKDGKFILKDLRSTSGTFVNSKRIYSQELEPGDEIGFADITLLFIDHRSDIIKRTKHDTKDIGIEDD